MRTVSPTNPDPGLGEWATQQRRKGGGMRQRNPADADHRLTTPWKAAVTRAHARPPVADAPSVRAELAALVAAADQNPATWAGVAGVTDRAVLAVLVDVAVAACTLTPSASTRQIAEAANVAHSTAAVSLERLRGRGWLRIEEVAAGTLATTWRLVRPNHVADPPRQVDDVLDALPPRSLTSAGGSLRGHDAFTHTIHGAEFACDCASVSRQDVGCGDPEPGSRRGQAPPAARHSAASAVARPATAVMTVTKTAAAWYLPRMTSPAPTNSTTETIRSSR